MTVLTQIVALDTQDLDSWRELARVHEALGRWRDLLTTQAKLADLEGDKGVKVELYRAIARRWLDQFSNVQNALEGYEKLAELAPEDGEAIAKLRELYTKRRAFKPLYDLLDRQAQRLEAGPARREVWAEMAKIAAERLDRGADAAAIYRKLLEEDAQAPGALDALEKQAERDKDWKTVAEVLERRVATAPDEAHKLVLLQRLGGVYTDRLQELEGAKNAWRRVLDLQPGHPKALRVLRDAYLAQADYEGLADCTSRRGTSRGSRRFSRPPPTRRPTHPQGRSVVPRGGGLRTEAEGSRTCVPRLRADPRVAPGRRTRSCGARPPLREGREVGAAAAALRGAPLSSRERRGEAARARPPRARHGSPAG